MILFLLAYLGGALTIISPCILPVLPFVFARADRPFLKSGLPMLAGMALMFVVVASLAAVGGGWAVTANLYGRWLALVLLALFGLTLLLPSLADRLTRPLVRLGDRLSQRADAQPGVGSALLLGIATGLLWAPCAGPILGLVLTGAALGGTSVATSLLLLAYALGAATSLALALLIGGRIFQSMKRSMGASEYIRQGLGGLVLLGVAAIAFSFDTSTLSRLSTASTTRLEQGLLNGFGVSDREMAKPSALAAEGPMPSLAGATSWINSSPLDAKALRGKVVLVDFWTYSCINCLRSLPYVKAWADKYRDQGLIVIGVHAPEFAFEQDLGNVRKAVRDLGIDYPVAVDNDRTIWRAFQNHYWPAHYFIDAQGRVRAHHYGEGDYTGSERIIQRLLAEAHGGSVSRDIVAVRGRGVEAAASRDQQSPETYIGYHKAQRWVGQPAQAPDVVAHYAADPRALNAWGLTGDWVVGGEHATLAWAGGGILYRFHARDLHLVLGPGADGKPVRFRVTIDGKAPGVDHGADTDAQGFGRVDGQRLYQLVRQSGAIGDRSFVITFLDPGVQAFSFTFG